MQVVLRTDASLDIGTGHVMRCLTLAEVLREKGAKCRFVCRHLPGNLFDLIRHSGFDVDALAAPQITSSPSSSGRGVYADWLGVDWAVDAAQTLNTLGESAIDWLIVDHYALDARWEKRLRQACQRVMVIDDLADRPHDCDLLLDQNLGRIATDYSDLVTERCRVLVGPGYALLRPEFASARDESFAHRAIPQLRHVLVAFGGVDKGNVTVRALDALKACPLPAECHITVVMGPHAPWTDQVRDKAEQMPWPTTVLVNVQDMARLMAASDLAIGAAGVSAWERCCLGLPTVIIILADNQRNGAAALEARGAAILLGEPDQLAGGLPGKVAYLSDLQKLQLMQQACSLLTDGAGASRLATLMTCEHD